MKPLYRIILFILICWFGYISIKQTFGSVAPGIQNLITDTALIVLLFLWITGLVSDIKSYRSNPKMYQFYTSFFGLLILGIFIFRVNLFSRIEKSKTIMFLKNQPGRREIDAIEFKENGFLIIEEAIETNTLPRHYYGKWYRKNDSLFITQTNHPQVSQKLPFSGIVILNKVIWNYEDTMMIGVKVK